MRPKSEVAAGSSQFRVAPEIRHDHRDLQQAGDSQTRAALEIDVSPKLIAGALV
jgi:hypothetical protein